MDMPWATTLVLTADIPGAEVSGLCCFTNLRLSILMILLFPSPLRLLRPTNVLPHLLLLPYPFGSVDYSLISRNLAYQLEMLIRAVVRDLAEGATSSRASIQLKRQSLGHVVCSSFSLCGNIGSHSMSIRACAH